MPLCPRSLRAVQLDLSTEQLELLVPGDCALSLQLPQTIALPPISAKFETERRILSLLLRTNAAGSLDGGLGGDEAASSGASCAIAAGASANDVLSEGVRREREREARINARRKRAAGNKQLARQAEAEAEAAVAAEAVAEGGGDGETPADEAGADAVAREAEEKEKEGAMVPAKAVEKPTGFLELTNSIMFELEELTGV